ncbi:hypothetical protein NQ318_016740 [Aromia moschata]|uniref:Serpin domain-containing protein n=1 Tax=Aromia moschata TaxID=1265417 RepID=A0AAV8XXE3_9CUCU|nr:hypothetical protein NQ318_016740 [Aromia moschata]
MSTQGESKLSETKTSTPTTTEQFIIKVMDNGDPLATTDKTLMESIEQLLSQAVGNVEEALANINDTEKIKNMLNSSSKNMTDIQIESATLASSMIDTNFDRNEEPKQTTTESSVPETTIFDDTRILNTKTNPTTITIPITEKLPETTIVNNDVGNTETYEKLPTEEKTTVSFESTTVSYVQLSALSKTDNDFELEPINTQSTILSIDHEDNNIQNLTKPAKSDVSLEQIIDEEIKKNISLTLNETTTTKLYNEETTTNNYDLNTNTLKNPSEILHTEETMSALHNGTAIKGNDINPYTENNEDIYENKTSILLPEKTTETSTDEVTQFTTTDHFVSLNDVLQVSKRPATIIIIKRTKKPSTEEPTTVAMNAETDFSNTNNLETTTAINDNLDLTTYIKQKFETTVTLPETTELYSDLNSENSTETTDDDGPTIEVIISEINQHVSETPRPMPTDQPVFVTTPVNPAHIKTVDDNINPQESSNIDIKISTDDHKNTGTTDSSPLQNENPSNNEGKPESTWTLVPTIAPHSDERIVQNYSPPVQHFPEIIEPPAPIDLTAKPLQGFGLEDSTSRLDTDIYQFAQLCNELAFGFWKTVTSGLSSARSVFVSPFGATSLLAMVFLGARGATSGEMNEILRLDDMVTFNPHLIFKNVSESIKTEEPDSGVASSAIIRELFSDRSKGKLLPFYKERAKAFYDGYVEEVSFREIGDVIRRRTNLQVKKYTNGRMAEFLKDSSVVARSPLAGVSINIFQTDCAQASTDGRDGELHFVVHPSIRQRRLVPIPAIVYKSGFLAGYEPSLDATAIALGTKEQTVSTILVIPGQQGVAAPGDGLARLEKRLVESSFKKGAWSRLLRSLIPRPGLEVQIPRFSHRSVINATVTLKRMGLHDLFDVENADLRGLNGVANELYLSDMLQVNSFATCGEKRIGETHHSEIYPATAASARNSRHLENYQSENIYYKSDLLEEPKDYQRAFHDPLHDPSYLSLPLSQRPRQARVPETPRLKFDRPFIYFVRHNPTGLILHMGRFNPRLLP